MENGGSEDSMAFISRQCVTCTDQTKRTEGRFRGRDEEGKRFTGPMYTCSNAYCPVYLERVRSQKKLRALEAFHESEGTQRK